MPICKFSKIFLFFLSVVFVFPLSSFAQNNTTEEIMTFETYYPAPYGVYNEMRSKRMAVGTDYYNASAYPWDTGDGCTGNEICNADLVVEGNVGIGPMGLPVVGPGPLQLPADAGGLTISGHMDSSPNRYFIDLKRRDQVEAGGGIRWRGNDNSILWQIAGQGAGTPGIYFKEGTTDRMVIRDGGRVGIGTMGPGAKLDVFVTSPDATTLDGSNIRSNLFGYTGDLLEISNTLSDGSFNFLKVTRDSDADAGGPFTEFIVTGTGLIGIGKANPVYGLDFEHNGTGPVRFRTTQNIVDYNAFWITTIRSNGATPILLLSSHDGADHEFKVLSNGEVQADGNYNTPAADYAEYFENLNNEAIEKGTVVALENGKAKVAEKGDTFIAGAVSTFPAFIGNGGEMEEERKNHPEKWTLVSLMGQVSVKVRGNIKHGDYIELDDNGVGRKAANWHPEVIGRAMEGYNSEDAGRITVLVK